MVEPRSTVRLCHKCRAGIGVRRRGGLTGFECEAHTVFAHLRWQMREVIPPKRREAIREPKRREGG